MVKPNFKFSLLTPEPILIGTMQYWPQHYTSSIFQSSFPVVTGYFKVEYPVISANESLLHSGCKHGLWFQNTENPSAVLVLRWGGVHTRIPWGNFLNRTAPISLLSSSKNGAGCRGSDKTRKRKNWRQVHLYYWKSFPWFSVCTQFFNHSSGSLDFTLLLRETVCLL